ncbi:hypothetical protein BJY04DRAFT_232119 [Aspergillus karnatakaensis]|uniref:uncharacterized protein n=1 Tax=Aspergillus karnatakaensis TaxID=1810916 RepID=UPI003CCDEFB0
MDPSALASRPIPKKRKATYACQTCRTLKVKCTGQQPCTRCVENKTECVLDPETDKRHKRLVNRRIDSLEEDQKLFIRLLRTLRHKNHHPSLEEIKLYMDNEMPREELEKTPELSQIHQGLATKPADRALNIARLCDIPPFSGPAKPWTTITDDDQFVSHLISLYFTWSCLAFSFIDRDFFLRDFDSGDANTLYCSPFLVNAMLADACYYSDYPESCAHFWREAKRLLDIEGDKLTLTTVQGLAVMYSCSSVMGKDRLGMTYFVRASEAILLLRSSYENSADDSPVKILSYLTLQKPAAMDCPTCDDLPIHQSNKEQWFPYPLLVEPSPAAHTNCVLNQKAKLGRIAWDLSNALFGDNSRLPRADIESAVNRTYARLLQWDMDLPECLPYNLQSIPEVLSLHMYYHVIIMTGFVFLKTPIPHADPATLQSIASARQKCISSAQAVSTLSSIATTLWGANSGDAANSDAFLNLAEAAVSVARLGLLPKGMFRLVQVVTLQLNDPDTLSPAISKLFKRFERRLWRREDHQRFSSAYPNSAAALRQQDGVVAEDLELDDFLEIWNDFSIAGQTDSSASEKER